MRISLYEMFCTDTLRHRETARSLIDNISIISNTEQVVIDFNNIVFASRSFCHELITELKRPNVKFINTNEEIKKMIQALDKPKLSLRITINA